MIKKITSKLASVLTVATLTTVAQPVIQYGNMPAGQSFNLYNLSGVNVSGIASQTGPNVTWDISSATPALVGTADLLDINSTPYAASYPAANFAIRFNPTGGSSVYSLFNIASTIWEEVANNVGSGGATDFIDYRTTLPYPFTYNLTNSDNYQKSGQAVKSISHHYDAYGTLITSFGTITNVVRDMLTDNGSTSASAYATSPYVYPLLQVSGSGVTLWVASLNGVEKYNAANIKMEVYPNPAQNSISIFTNASINTLEICDVNGKAHIKTNQATIDVSQLSSGVYFIKAITNEGVVNRKFIKE
ncbi:MAG: T9SS type A sorting domain-containing protein [Bacteroidia bacterium]